MQHTDERELTWFSLNCDTVCALVQRLDHNVDKVKLTLQHTTAKEQHCNQ